MPATSGTMHGIPKPTEPRRRRWPCERRVSSASSPGASPRRSWQVRNPEPDALHPTPYTLNLTLQIITSTPDALHPESRIPHPRVYTLHPKP